MEVFKLLKRIPHALLLFILIIIAGVAEAIGISSLVPVASTLTTDGQELPFPFDYLPVFFNIIGLNVYF